MSVTLLYHGVAEKGEAALLEENQSLGYIYGRYLIGQKPSRDHPRHTVLWREFRDCKLRVFAEAG